MVLTVTQQPIIDLLLWWCISTNNSISSFGKWELHTLRPRPIKDYKFNKLEQWPFKIYNGHLLLIVKPCRTVNNIEIQDIIFEVKWTILF